MSPTSNAYFDYGQTKLKGQPATIGGYLPIKTVYGYEPTPAKLKPDEAKHILGAQGNIWTEYMPNMLQVELMAFPRACAMAEVTWTAADRKDFKDFHRRLEGLKKRLSVLQVNYFEDPLDEPETDPTGNWTPGQMSETPVPLRWDATRVVTQPGKYQVDLEYTGGACRLDISWVALAADGVEIARDTHNGTTGGSNKYNSYELTVPEFKEGVKYTLVTQVRSDGGTDSNGTVTLSFVP